MKYLLDTDVVISHIKKKFSIPNLPGQTDEYITCVINYGELLYGATTEEKQIILSLFKELKVHIISVDEKIIEIYVSLRKKLEPKGERLADYDLLVAATAIHTQATLVTRNKKHFARIPGLVLA